MRPYDFRETERLSREHARALTPVMKTTARLAGNLLSSWLGTAVDFHAGGIAEATYDQLLDPRADDGTIVAVFACGDSERTPEAMMVLPRMLIDGLIERLMGGDGKHEAPSGPRTLTDFDRAIANKVAGKVLESLEEAFEGKVVVVGTMKRTEMDRKRLPRNHQPTEPYLTSGFTVTVNNQTHTLKLALPQKFLEPVTDEAPAEASVDPVSVDRCGRLPLTVRAEFAHRDVTLQEMLELRPGRILMLDPKSVQNVVVRVEGEAKFAARPGRMGDRMVVEITRAFTEDDHADLLG